MGDTAIRIENLSKLYQIGKREPYPTLRAAINDSCAAAARRLGFNFSSPNSLKPKEVGEIWEGSHPNHIWALRNISFHISKGETLGIIGLNGSGKSTLLKLLAQITEPTEGAIYINGRVTALIELGAGFHPELTGRENIYLYGTILGLSKKEVDVRFKEIVDFAELRDFIDTPVKHFSTGMTVRLGFSVAVSVDPEILLIDEVLAVGDASFRKRCFDRIETFIKAGKTIVLVTHNLDEVQRIARRAILVDHGIVKIDGPPDKVIAQYTDITTGRPG